MKELSRFEMAAVKRTAQNVKNMRRKKEKLEEKQADITAEINQLAEMIDSWEQPIIRLTGGFTSEQILNGEMNTDVATSAEVEVINDATLDDSPNEYVKQNDFTNNEVSEVITSNNAFEVQDTNEGTEEQSDENPFKD